MKHFEVKVNNETVDYIERLAFEVEGMKKVVKEIITDAQDNPAVLDGAAFQTYEKRYQERNAAYEVAKNELQKTWIPQDLQNKIVTWNLDFSTGILSFDANVADDYQLGRQEA